MEKQTIGGFLAALRKANGYTQAEVAEKLGVSNKTLSSWETDKTCPDLTLVPVLADLYGVTSDEILRAERRKPQEVLSEETVGKKSTENAKNIRAILKKKELGFRNRNYVLRGVSVTVWILLLAALLLAGIAQIIFGILFTAGMVTLVVLLHVFSENALGFVPEDEECGRPEDVAAYKKKIYSQKYGTAAFIAAPLFLLVLCLPLILGFSVTGGN